MNSEHVWQRTVEKKRAVRAFPMRFGTHSYQNPFIVYLQFKFDWLSCILSGNLSLRLEVLEWWPGGCVTSWVRTRVSS